MSELPLQHYCSRSRENGEETKEVTINGQLIVRTVCTWMHIHTSLLDYVIEFYYTVRFIYHKVVYGYQVLCKTMYASGRCYDPI
jgi:hypothetical protein